MLGKHEKTLWLLNEQQGSNNQSLNQVFELLKDVHVRLSNSSPGISSASSLVPLPISQEATLEPVFQDAAFLTPDHYSVDTNRCKGFLFQGSLAFARSPCSFSTDAAKISFIVALLRNKALDWALAFFQLNSIDSFSFSAFQLEQKRTFDHPLRETNAAKKF